MGKSTSGKAAIGLLLGGAAVGAAIYMSRGNLLKLPVAETPAAAPDLLKKATPPVIVYTPPNDTELTATPTDHTVPVTTGTVSPKVQPIYMPATLTDASAFADANGLDFTGPNPAGSDINRIAAMPNVYPLGQTQVTILQALQDYIQNQRSGVQNYLTQGYYGLSVYSVFPKGTLQG